MFRTTMLLLTATLLGCSPSTDDGAIENVEFKGVMATAVAGTKQTAEAAEFTAEFPPGWYVTRDPQLSYVIIRHSPSELSGSIAITSAPPPATPAALAEEMLRQRPMAAKVETETRTVVAGREAIRIDDLPTGGIDAAPHDPNQLHVLAIVVPLDSGVMNIQFKGNPDAFATVQQELEAIIASIKLKQP